MARSDYYESRQSALKSLHAAVHPASYDPVRESAEEHRDRLFLQILLSLTVNILALLGIFYFLLPLSDQGRATGGLLLWGVFGVTLGITAVFLTFNLRVLCVNLLLGALSAILVGASFFLGGVMSPTMIFLTAMPVLAVTLMGNRWAYLWTAMTVGGWLLVLVLESSGMEMSRVTREANVGTVQVISLLGTALVVMAVLRSYVSANSRLRKAMEYKADYLDYLASHDSLTAIPNRRAFFESAHRCLKRSERSGKPFALLVIDLNDFKQINDERGHKVGDAVLQHFAVRLTTGFRETDFVGRVGGDEFAVVLEPVDSIEGVERVVERFRNVTECQVEVDGAVVSYECAIGSALYPECGQDVAALFEAADSAMYRSKRGSPTEFLWK